jgi:CheY-like chemotaxis protein
MNSAPSVAIVNTNPDLVEMLKTEVERAGLVVTTVHVEDIRLGKVDVAAFLEQHDPRVIVYDVVPPYDRSWRFLEHLRNSPAFKGRHFVLTTPNPARLREVVGTDETVYEILGEPRDLGTIVTAVREASRARAVRG